MLVFLLEQIVQIVDVSLRTKLMIEIGKILRM